jgi:predicted GTPase
MSKKDRSEEFENTSSAKMIDDDGYEEGKSKDRELVADISDKDKLMRDTTPGGKILCW